MERQSTGGPSAPPDYQALRFAYRRHSDQDVAEAPRRPVVVVGAGPVGLALAVDLAQRGISTVVLDDDDTLSSGSRAICFSKRTLEIFDRLGCGDRMVEKGVSWNIGKVFHRDAQVYRFDLLPEVGHERPAFVNLQQYYVEGYLVERALELPSVDIRWKNEVVGLEQSGDHVTLTIETPDGPYTLRADFVAACDGSRSRVRRLLGLESKGRTFHDRFLIADVKMRYDGPAERWFWFDPPFHRGQSVLLHRQPDDVWRVDFQLGWEADPELERRPERIIPRVRALLAHTGMKNCSFTLEWASVYTFSCLRMERFHHGRVLFAGDSAHGVSPFGARGANSGIQDAENLAWKLACVLRGEAPDGLLDTYAAEREYAADVNILNSTRSTDFITPKSAVSRLFRDAVLALARENEFARTLVNSGRLSVPAMLRDSPANTADTDTFEGGLSPGAVAADAPVVRPDGSPGWLLRELGAGFTLLIGDRVDEACMRQLSSLRGAGVPWQVVELSIAAEAGPNSIRDAAGLVASRYDLRPGTAYLLRPDHHVCARWRSIDPRQVAAAMRRALGVAEEG